MSTDYIFSPYERQGLIKNISSNDPVEGNRPNLDVKLKINSKALIQGQPKLYGPGDITGFKEDIITRYEPKDKIGDFEPNYFSFVEFAESDFPWAITPKQQENEKLIPWINLIVLKTPGDKFDADNNHEDLGEYEYVPFDKQSPCNRIKVKSIQKSLPDLNQSWGWAHVQVIPGQLDVNEPEKIVKNYPARAISRLMCPRRLEPGTLYTAFIVPSFESGRFAGLGWPQADVSAYDTLAWDITNDAEIELPFYKKWEFRTGLRGDFEHLVRLLEPKVLDNRVGKRYIDISEPGLGISGIKLTNPPANHPSDSALEVEGALLPLNHTSTPWPDNADDKFKEELAEILNLPNTLSQDGNDQNPVIVPDIYGKYHANKNKIEPNGNDDYWLKQLNLDPRNRVVAGFGTSVVQDQQESIMHEAWRQAGDVEKANQIILQTQLAENVSHTYLTKKLLDLKGNEFLKLTAPVHSRVLQKTTENGQTETVKSYLGKTKITPAMFDPAFRKAFRSAGLSANRKGNSDNDDIYSRVNNAEVRGKGQNMKRQNFGFINNVLEKPWYTKGFIWKVLKILPLILLLALLVLLVLIFMKFGSFSNIVYSNPLVIAAQIVLAFYIFIKFKLNPKGYINENLSEEKIDSEFIENATPPANFTGDKEEFKALAKAFQDYLNIIPEEKEKPKADIDAATCSIFEGIEPKTTLNKRLSTVLQFNSNSLSRMEVIMAYPKFDRPMYEPLRDISQELLLPGLEFISQNTITLLENNNKFINAYMAGINVETLKEFRWREYLTDFKGTPFQQFWDVSEVVLPQSVEDEMLSDIQATFEDMLSAMSAEGREIFIQNKLDEKIAEKLRDIEPIHQWQDDSLNTSKKPVNEIKEARLALLIRGDLLKKYPNTVIYALQAEFTGDNNKRKPRLADIQEEVLDPDKVKFPVFKGTLDPDITFLGFDITETQAKGSTEVADNNPGWFFILEERIAETRFGADAYLPGDELPADFVNWNNFSWGHFFEETGDEIICNLPASGYIDAIKPRTNNTQIAKWDSDAGKKAALTCQKPVRIAIHADDMIP